MDYFESINHIISAGADRMGGAFLVTTRTLLLDALKRIAPAVDKNRKSFAIVKSVRFDIGEDLVTLTATNLELRVRVKLGVERSTNTVSICIPYCTLFRAVSSLRERIGFFSEGDGIHIRDGISKIALPCLPPTDFPKGSLNFDMPIIPASVPDSKRFFEDLRRAANVAGKDDTRKAICTVCVENEGDFVRVVSTDGKRLLSLESAKNETTPIPRVLIPKRWVDAIASAFRGEKGAVYLHWNEKHLGIFNGSVRVTVRLVEGEYPNYRAAIPQPGETPYRFTFSSLFMLGALKVAAVNLSPWTAVDVFLRSDRLTVRGIDVDKHASECVLPVPEGSLTLPPGEEEIHFMFNPDFLAYAYRTAEEPTMQYADLVSPLVFTIPGGVYVLMPVRRR